MVSGLAHRPLSCDLPRERPERLFLLVEEERPNGESVVLAVGALEDDALETTGDVLDPEGGDFVRGHRPMGQEDPAAAVVGTRLEIRRRERWPRPGDRDGPAGRALGQDAAIGSGLVDVGADRSASVEVLESLGEPDESRSSKGVRALGGLLVQGLIVTVLSSPPARSAKIVLGASAMPPAK
jgi:hypothetical protein